MAKRVQFRRGTSTQHSSFIGALGEITVDTTLKTLRVHDNVEVGGSVLATQDALDNTVVKLTGNQTIGGVKTFSTNIVGNVIGNVTGNSDTATKLAASRTINGVLFDGSANIIVSDSSAVKLTGNQSIDSVKTFTSSPIVPTPTAGDQAANKAYADLKAALSSFTGTNQSLEMNGYQKLPGGLIIQWGSATTTGDGGVLITFPISFPNNAWQVGLGLLSGSPINAYTSYNNLTTSGMQIFTNAAGGIPQLGTVSYIIIGN